MSLEALPEELDELERPIYGPYEYVRRLLTPDMTVLDVGCGNAKVSAYLAESGATVDGIEPTGSRASVAAARVRHLSVVPAGENDPQLDATYDVITFFDVLEHLTGPADILAWATTRLAAGGRIIAAIPNSAHISFRKKMLRGDWAMSDWGLFDRTHVRFFDPDTMLALRPVGTDLVDRRFFAPDAADGWKARRLARWPRLYALHAVLVWELIP